MPNHCHNSLVMSAATLPELVENYIGKNNDTRWNTHGETPETIENPPPVNYETLFELWADFDDAEASGDAMRLIETSGMGKVDALSFAAFCYGYEQAVQKLTETQ